MLATQGASALVRLSDAVKSAVEMLAETTTSAIAHFEPYTEAVKALQNAAKDIRRDRGEADLEAIATAIAEDGVLKAVALQQRIHSQALSTILLCCFTLESYINSLAHFLVIERDVLNLARNGDDAVARFDEIERLSVREKWECVAGLVQGQTFDKARSPWQDFDILFKFRDDHVHDKVVPHWVDRATKRYNNRLPDPVGGLLDIKHAYFSARTYWSMIAAIHDLIGIPVGEFQRHYNLSPWPSAYSPEAIKQLAERYRESLHPEK